MWRGLGGRLRPELLCRRTAQLQEDVVRPFLTQRRYRSLFRHVDRWQEPEEPELPKDNHPELSPDDMEFYQDNLADFIDDQEEVVAEEARKQQQQKIRDELDAREGRGWSDPWALKEEDWSSSMKFDDLPDWDPSMASRVSLDRVRVYPGGIPSLRDLSDMKLAHPPPPNPGSGATRAYARQRKEALIEHVAKRVAELAEPRIPPIQSLPTWEEKQDAVDELFESVEFQLKDEEEVLGRHPNFGTWVEESLEKYLEGIQAKDKDDSSSLPDSTDADDADEAHPIFVDLFTEEDEYGPVPAILHPLAPHPKGGAGRMVEEWQLAGHEKMRRIMLRQSTQLIANALVENESARVYVSGVRGVGKTAALAAIVASARRSGYLVMYIPDGDRLRKHGGYIEPSYKTKGLYDLPILSSEVCSQFLSSHEDDLGEMTATEETRSQFFTNDQLQRMPEEYRNDLSLVALLKLGKEQPTYAPACYSTVVETLKNQSDKPFLFVIDEFNCYYDHGHYFHADYDLEVEKSIPCDKITLFKPFLDAISLSSSDQESAEEAPVKRGGVVVGITESRAVARRFTDALSESAYKDSQAGESATPLVFVDVPRYSEQELEHVLSNMEVTGVGRLRFDRGSTVMDEQEVAYLRMVSGAVGQNLLDACIV